MAVDFDFRDMSIRPINRPSQFLNCFAAALDNVLCATLEENLANIVSLGGFGSGGEPVRVERLRQRKMLLGNDST